MRVLASHLVLLLALACVAAPAVPAALRALASAPRTHATAPERSRAAASATPRDADGFALAVPPYAFAFPRDHASHPGFRTEWWYYTGHIAAGARRFGYELTFFRVGLPHLRAGSTSAWAARDLVFEHVALTDETGSRFRCADEARRPALGIAGADSTRYDVWLDDDHARLAHDGRTHLLRGQGQDFGFTLALVPGKPPAVHGEDGVSQKTAGAGNASHYYSLTRMATRGTLRVAGDSLAVDGVSWMDHEFGSSRMADTHAGWDWFSVQLDDGRELMLYRLRRRDGGIEPLSSGTLVERDGRTRHLALADFAIDSTGAWTSPRTHARYPSGWRLRVPSADIALVLEPTVRDQELVAAQMGGVAYWEGSVRVLGTAGGRPVTGEGYVELTGYGGRGPF